MSRDEPDSIEFSLQRIADALEMFWNVEVVFEGEVKPIGTGSHITIPKRYLGRQVKIIILKDKEESP